jgi:nucleotide-binding universal stress UspA family protein
MSDPLHFQTILVPVDFSASSHAAVDLAADLAQAAGPAHIILAHAYYLPADIEGLLPDDQGPLLDRLSKAATHELEGLLIGLQDRGISSEFLVVRGYPERTITALAEDKGADVIVMGTRGRTGLAHIALGSIAERVVQTAKCPVITTRAEKNA